MAAMHDEIPRIRAERLLDMAQAAAFPHLTKEGRTRWLKSVGQVSRRAAIAAAKSEGGLTWNGQPIRTREGFKRMLALTFGGPVPEAAPGRTPRGVGPSRSSGVAEGAARPARPPSRWAGGRHPGAPPLNGTGS